MSQNRRNASTALLALLLVLVAGGALAIPANHLVISELVMKERPGVPSFGSEFIEILNAGTATVDLSQVYLTDANNSLNANTYYYNVVKAASLGGGGSSGDFHARFPAGAELAPGEAIVVSLRGSAAFNTSYARLPDYELFEDGTSLDAVPDMVEVFPGSIGAGLVNGNTNEVPSTGWLDDSNEALVLYTWDGTSDLVQDLDYLAWGTNTTLRVSKTGVVIDGADAGTTTSAYLPDTAVASQQALTSHTYGQSFRRISTDEGAEPATGGTGVGGHDETGEPGTPTWNAAATPQDPTSTGTPVDAAPQVAGSSLSPTVPYATGPVTVTVTTLAPAGNAVTAARLVYTIDGGAAQTVACSSSGSDWSGVIPTQAVGAVVKWHVELDGQLGTLTAWPVSAPLYDRTYTVQQEPIPGDGPAHLLLTEVCVQGTNQEFIEIYNPTDEAVELDNYYLTDAVYNTQGYWKLPEGSPSTATIGGGDFFDFQARFPAGATIEPGEAMTLALAGASAFETEWGVQPDFEVSGMREVFPGSLFGATDGTTPATLTNAAELVVLYYWDGASDLVTDIDMFFWGSSTSARVDRMNYTIGSSSYASDTPVASQDQFLAVHEIGGSFQRLDPAEGSEPATGGNGPEGDDETGENLSGTWVAAAGTPGVYGDVAVMITGVTRSPSTPQPTVPAAIVATVSGSETVNAVTLSYRVDAGAFSNVNLTDNLDGTWSGQIPGQALDAVVEYYVEAATLEGSSAVWPTGAPTELASYTVREPIGPGDYPPHLLLTEVCGANSPNEFVEIYNPTSETVDLGDYYLTDAVYNTQGYWHLPEGNPSTATVGGGDFYDFNARFPDGAVIEPGESLTIAIAGSDAFSGVWGVQPDFEIVEDGNGSDAVGNMREVFPGSLYGATDGTTLATLTNGAELIALYYWDGVSDLVTDIDLFFWGSSTSARVDKTGVTIGSSTYADDTPIANQDQFLAVHENGGSYQRLDPEEGNEVETGGNGSLGHDETSENLSGTWTAQTPGTPGQFGVVQVAVTGAALTPRRPQPGEEAVVTTGVSGAATDIAVTLYYTLDGGAAVIVTCTDDGAGTWSGTIPAQAEDVVVTWYVKVTGGGVTEYWPDGAPGTTEAYTVRTLVAGEGLARLLLSEVCTLGSTAEFIEIYNPTDFDVPLANYYLTDAVYYEDQAYWNLPAGTPTQATLGGGAFGDFHAQFPADAVIAAGDTITITVPGSMAFETTFGTQPHYELFEDNDFSDYVPDMLEVFPGSNANAPTLTNLTDTGTYINGEMVALYYWDGVADLVTDIDVFVWGDGNSYTAVKSGRTIGESTYATDAGYAPFMLPHVHLESYTRVDFDEGTEATSGGNGYEGADETSENFVDTWAVMAASPTGKAAPAGNGKVTLRVPAATFLPTYGERFEILFTASPGAETTLRLFDLEGRLVRVLYDSRFDGNASTIEDYPSVSVWDGRNEVFELVRAGMYVVHLQVVDPITGNKTEKTAPAVVATRLSN